MKQHTEEKHHHMDKDRSDEMFEDEIVDISTENNAPIEDTSATFSQLYSKLERIKD